MEDRACSSGLSGGLDSLRVGQIGSIFSICCCLFALTIQVV
jgi:hypothetical protein